jgi:tetratricopeptide (TPR) repeat protein
MENKGKKDKKKEEIFENGVDHLENGRLNDAANAFEEVIKMDQEDASAHFNLGLVFMRMVREDVDREELYEEHTDEEGLMLRAISEFNRVLEIEPDNEDAKRNIEALEELLEKGV